MEGGTGPLSTVNIFYREPYSRGALGLGSRASKVRLAPFEPYFTLSVDVPLTSYLLLQYTITWQRRRLSPVGL